MLLLRETTIKKSLNSMTYFIEMNDLKENLAIYFSTILPLDF